MGDEFICHGAMAQGILVRPFDLTIRSPRSYFLVVPPEKAANPAVAAFRSWMADELPMA
jgi:LysR family glycine cleavage system transcriptional activator